MGSLAKSLFILVVQISFSPLKSKRYQHFPILVGGEPALTGPAYLE
jgi:hypothetical protein